MDKNEKNVVTTVFDYLRWRGDLTFAQDAFNEVDNLVLCIITYLNFRRFPELRSREPENAVLLGDIVPRMTAEDVYTTAEEDGSVSGAAARRKVIVTARYEVQTQKFTEAVQRLEALVQEQGGYVEESDISGESTDNGSGYYVLRLPTDKVEGFGAALAQVGTVQSHSRSEEKIGQLYQVGPSPVGGFTVSAGACGR